MYLHCCVVGRVGIMALFGSARQVPGSQSFHSVQSRENKKLKLGSLILKMDRVEAEAAERAAAAEAETQREKNPSKVPNG
jgi:hypothetical protein